MQMKNRLVSEYANENLSIGTVSNPFLLNSSQKCNFCCVKLTLQHLFVNNFLTKDMQMKNLFRNVRTKSYRFHFEHSRYDLNLFAFDPSRNFTFKC